MLLKAGFVMMAFAAVLTGVVIAVVSTEESARSAVVKSAAESTAEPLKRTDPMIKPWREKEITVPTPEEPKEETDPERKYGSEPAPELEPESEPKTQPIPDPELPEPEPALPEPERSPPEPETPGSEQAPEPAPALQPVFTGKPPESTVEDIASARSPRHYKLPDGAVMGLTIKAIGIRDVPVFDSVGEWALGHGVGHHPETSMPWSDAPQRNVYLAGHRLGFPGTDSNLIFYRLDELGDGDEILLKDRDGKKYRYRVSETFKATPKDSWVMGQIRDRDMVTLQTCSGPNWERRLIVRADRL